MLTVAEMKLFRGRLAEFRTFEWGLGGMLYAYRTTFLKSYSWQLLALALALALACDGTHRQSKLLLTASGQQGWNLRLKMSWNLLSIQVPCSQPLIPKTDGRDSP